MSFNPIPYDLLEGLLSWCILAGTFLVLLLIVGTITALLVRGRQGPAAIKSTLKAMLMDWVTLSPRRVGALASLTFKESIRRKTLLVFVIFAVLFMFAGWFLSGTPDRGDLQVKVYVSFVLRTISWLCLPVVLLLSCWGLPEDIRVRSLHTVVTKPARRNEIVVGRILGFAAVATIVLGVMAVVGFIWIPRQIPESSRDRLTCRVPVYGELRFLGRMGEPSERGLNTGDVWDFRSYVEGATKAAAIWTFEDVTPERVGGDLNLEARFESFRTHKGRMGKELMAQLSFANPIRENMARAFADSAVLKELASTVTDGQFARLADELRLLGDNLDAGRISHPQQELDAIQPQTELVVAELRPLAEKHPDEEGLSQLIERFEKVGDAAVSPGGRSLPAALNMLADVIDEHRAMIESLVIDRRATVQTFEVKEYREQGNDLKLTRETKVTEDGELKTVDLFDTFVHGGRLQVEVRCIDAGQLIGMARPDLFIKTPNRPFASGYFKSIFGIWLMLILVIVIGVSASTFLKGPVATLLTLVFVILGTAFHEFLFQLVGGDWEGGGAIESAIRLARHMNPSMEFSEGGSSQAVRAVDAAFDGSLWIASKVVPDFTSFGKTAEFVANGFDVPLMAGVAPCVATTLAYIVPCLLLAHFALKIRELEAK